MDDNAKKIMSVQVMRNALHWMKTAERQQLGKLGEMYVEWWFVSQGYRAEDTSKVKHSGDVSILSKSTGETIRIEVKTAKQDSRGRYQFCLRKKGKTNICHSDYVILLAVDNHGKLYRYLVPCEVLREIQKIEITSHPTNYTGRLSAFLVHGDKINLQETYQLIGEKTA